MMLKTKYQELSKELLGSLIGKTVHVVKNNLTFKHKVTGEKKVQNVWCAGRVAGLGIEVIGYDYVTDTFTDTLVTQYTLMLTDGAAYTLALDCVIKELTEKEFQELLDAEDKKSSILIPGRDF